MERALGSSAPLFQRSLWWMVPAWLIGRIRPTLARATDADAIVLGLRNPILVGVVLPVAALLLALVPSVIHAQTTTPLSSDNLDYFRFRIDDVYTESLVLMGAAIVLGVLSPAWGAYFVLAFAVFDIVAASRQGNELRPLLGALVGRLVSYWLLWLLVVEIPAWGRSLAETVGGGRVGRVRSLIVGTLATSGFVAIWVTAAPTLVRPVYSLTLSPKPQIVSMLPLQQAGWTLVAVAAVVAAVSFALRAPEDLLGRPPRPIGAWPAGHGPVLAVVRHVAVAALLTVGLIGLVQRPLDALILFATLVATRPIASILMERTGLGRLTALLPTVVRVALAVGAAFAVAALIVPRLYTPNDQTFFAVIVGLIGALFAAELLVVDRGSTGRPGPEATPVPMIPPAVVGLVAPLLLLALWLLAPGTVLADNCSDPGDCYGLGAGAAAAAGGAGAMINGRKKTPPKHDQDLIDKKLQYIDKMMKKDPNNPYWQQQQKYWSGPGADNPGSDNKPTSGAAFGSSGAATKA